MKELGRIYKRMMMNAYTTNVPTGYYNGDGEWVAAGMLDLEQIEELEFTTHERLRFDSE